MKIFLSLIAIFFFLINGFVCISGDGVENNLNKGKLLVSLQPQKVNLLFVANIEDIYLGFLKNQYYLTNQNNHLTKKVCLNARFKLSTNGEIIKEHWGSNISNINFKIEKNGIISDCKATFESKFIKFSEERYVLGFQITVSGGPKTLIYVVEIEAKVYSFFENYQLVITESSSKETDVLLFVTNRNENELFKEILTTYSN